MSAESAGVEWVRLVARNLGELVDEVVFLGGATIALLITDPGTASIRPTKDIDLIVEVGTWREYAQFLDRLRTRGFSEDTDEGAPICRWVIAGVKVDIMPTGEEVLGFSNRWYQAAVCAATRYPLDTNLTISLITGPYFMATKFEAFQHRGDRDYQLSHDIEDVIAVVDGRPEILQEIASADGEVREYLRQQIGVLLDDEDFLSALPGHLPGDPGSQKRVPVVVARLKEIAKGS